MNDKTKKSAAARRLEQLSLYYHVTYVELAEITGVSRHTIYRVTSGDKELSIQTAARIADELYKKRGWHVSRDWLATGVGNMIEGPEIGDSFDLSDAGKVETAAEDVPHDGMDYRERYYDLLAEFIELQRKYTNLLEKLSR